MIPLVDKLVDLAIAEDIGTGDITTDNLVPAERQGSAVIVAKEPLIVAGLDIARDVFARFDRDARFKPCCAEGDLVETGGTLVELNGKLAALLKGERIALNFLQRLSGIATHVRAYMKLTGKSKVHLVDTRKTTPGWRVLEKHAVRVGGASNHRMGLYDGVLIKDNHIAVCGGVKKAIDRIRGRVSHLVKIEIEASDLDQVREALEAGADVIMLDNMDLEQTRQAVALIAKRAMVEISGNITDKNIERLIDTGVDIISSGALTHAARAVDISMKING